MSSYSLVKFIQQVSEQHKRYEEVRIKLVKEFSEKDEKGKPIVEDNKFKLDEKRLEEFNKQVGDLLALEEEYDLMKKITIPEKMLPSDTLLLEDILDLSNK